MKLCRISRDVCQEVSLEGCIWHFISSFFETEYVAWDKIHDELKVKGSKEERWPDGHTRLGHEITRLGQESQRLPPVLQHRNN